MRITRLLLRNYRVFADELELEVPPGLVGVYGPNGAGKSSLVEAIPFALWGSSRTSTNQIRTAGIDAEAVVEVEIEHESHCYVVRRTISGINHSLRARVEVNGLQVADGSREVGRYLRSVLGLDDSAFRASVFAEQKQLAAFTTTTPAKRRDLVLRLLGITPLDAARDRARAEARGAYGDLERLRGLLPDLEPLAATAEQAAVDAAEAKAAARRADVELGERRRQLSQARRAHDEWVVRAAEHEALVTEGREVRRHHDGVTRRIGELTEELSGLADAEARAEACHREAEGLDVLEARIRALVEVARAQEAVSAARDRLGPEPPAADEGAHERLRQAAADAASAWRAHRATGEEVGRHRAAAAAAAEDASTLSGEGDCPLCGQALGSAFEAVRSHRRQELARADARLAELADAEATLAGTARAAEKAAEEAAARAAQAHRARAGWDQQRAALAAAEEVLDDARRRLGPGPRSGEAAALEAEAERKRRAGAEHQRLQGRLERAPRARAELAELAHDGDSLRGRLETLREKVRAAGFSPDALAAARQAFDLADAAQHRADEVARQAEMAVARAEARADGAHQQLVGAQEQHARLGALEDEARHLGRLAELMSDFRNQLVGAVGPRLSRQAASLFAELTDAEYDELQVDPDTYGIEILDQGVAYTLDRFSGSESDLASLALRVAISEHLCFQSGGQIGLLVLDEVFGPLDADRKDRMLAALERLKGRFRQVLVVTHDGDVKDQLPNAIEVVKLAGRRATARLTPGA